MLRNKNLSQNGISERHIYCDAMNKVWCEKQVRFRHYLKDLRHSSGLTQRELAELLKKPQSYVSKYENGERKLDFLETVEVFEACGRYDVSQLIQAIKDPKNK